MTLTGLRAREAPSRHRQSENAHLHAPARLRLFFALARGARWIRALGSRALGARDKVGPRPNARGISRKMRWLAPLVLMVSLSACLQIGKAGESGSSADEASSGGSGASSSGGAPATGTNCGVDPSTGVALCLGISSCPSVRVDPDQFPDCGFRVAGSKLDLECLCGDALCPMGSAASCLDAKALLAEQSAQSVCSGVAEGRCQVVHETSHTSSSACDKDCRAQCSGVPGCITLCGC